MQIILLHDVAKIGRRYAVVEVPDGFARNKLIPTKAAVPATADNLKRYTAITSHAVKNKAATDSALAENLLKLKEAKITVAGSANAQGHLYQAVTKEDIAKATLALKAPVPAEALVIPTPLKQVGTYEIRMSSGTVQGVITIEIIAK